MRTFSGRGPALTGAGSGIGRALATALARQGARLALSDIDEAGLAETVAQCEAFGVRITSAQLDVADRDAVSLWADVAVADFGRVNLVINNAGAALGKAPAQILTAVRRDRRRALIGSDAKAIDLISRLPATMYQSVLTRGATSLRVYADDAGVRAPNPLRSVPMASRQRRSIDSVEVPSRPAASANAIPWSNATRTWETSVSSPRRRPRSIHRRTRPTIRIRTELVAASSSGPGEKSVKGRENITSANARLARMNLRYADAVVHRSARGSAVSASVVNSSESCRKPWKYNWRTTPALSPNSS
jgi:hypothetical protein